MRHRKKISKLGRPRAHRKALVNSLVRSLFLYDRITTTLPKAKAAQRLAERLVNRSKRSDVSARRYAYSYLNDHQLVKRLFDEVKPRFDDRTSGFTRIFLLGNRPGDGAQMAVLEMIVKGEEPKKSAKTSTAAKKTQSKQTKSKTSAKESVKESAETRKSQSKKKKQSEKK